MSVFFVPFDSTSRKKGAGVSADGLHKVAKRFFPDIDWRKLDCQGLSAIELSIVLPTILEQKQIRGLIGGEHLITYYSFLQARKNISNKNLKLILFDAHHDAYPNEDLSHYSFVEWLVREHNVEVLIIGARYELEKCLSKIQWLNMKDLEQNDAKARINNFIDDCPFYLSVDIDALDPAIFKSIAHPVPQGLSVPLFEDFYDFLLSKRPVFLDIVEFHLKKGSLQEAKIILNWMKRYLNQTLSVAPPDSQGKTQKAL